MDRTVISPGRNAVRALIATVALLASLFGSGGPVPAGAEDPGGPGRPLAFEVNRGQVDSRVQFLARAAAYTVFLTSGEAVVSLRDRRHDRAVVRMKLVGANPSPSLRGENALDGRVNYFGAGAHVPQATDVPTYAQVRYLDVHPGVDLVFYGDARRLEYDFIVAPGADPGAIALAFEGADRLELDARGDLVLHTGGGEIRQPRPTIYQEIEGVRHAVWGGYVLMDQGQVGFRVETYDRTRPLVIDPLLLHSTYLGGSDDEGDPLYGSASSIAVDAAGNMYVTGVTRSVDFPTTPGAVRTLSGDEDAFVTKLSPTGAVVYSTYIGGPCDDQGRGIAVDAAGNAYITGRAHGGICFQDGLSPGALVAKLNPTGGVVYFRTYGGQYADTSVGQAIAVDGQGHAYVTGSTSSADFPTTPGAYRTVFCGGYLADGFVAKLDAASGDLVYSTYLCGNDHESPNDIAIDAAGNAYVAGSTHSHDFPVVNAFLDHHPGGPVGVAGFVAKLNAAGSDLIYSTYLGGWLDSFVQGLAIDAQGHAYVTGATQSFDFPTTSGVLQPTPGPWYCGGTFCTHAFVSKLSPAGSALEYSTYLFGEFHDSGARIAVDGAGNAYVVGETSSLYFPILDAFQSTNRGLSDVFVAKLDPGGTRLIYSSYLGGGRRPESSAITEGSDSGVDIALDAAGNAYVTGYTSSLNFPTTPGAYQSTAGGGDCFYGEPCGDTFVAKISAGGPGVVPPLHIIATPTELPPGGTVTATWAGIADPTAADEIRLYPLGGDTPIAAWPTGGAAAEILPLALPAALPVGTYELRLVHTDRTTLLWSVVARSHPVLVGAVSSDLVVTDVAWTPAQPTAGQAVQVTVTVANQGTGGAGTFAVDFYKHRTTAPVPAIAGDLRCTVIALAAAASTQCTGTVTYATAGAFSAWAQVDTTQSVPESSESNNVSGPRAMAVVAPRADLVVLAVGNPPTSAASGATFSASDTVKNQGPASAPLSKTRYYLSRDGARDGATLLTGLRSVAALAPGAQSAGTASVTIPAGVAAGSYHLLACADDTALVAEDSETNNCAAAAGTIAVGRPDLVEITLTNPPALAKPGTGFSLTHTVANQGAAAAGTSTTRYYLSRDVQKSAADALLAGTHAVPALAPGASSTRTLTVTIAAGTPPGTYVLLACADDGQVVAEDSETNNCLASAGTVTVALPDLVQQSVSNPGGPFRPGAHVTVSDTVFNDSPIATGKSSTTKYYLSVDGTRSADDKLLTGTRTIANLAPFTGSSGSVAVTIPSSTLPRTYTLLACADNTGAVPEASETNNCRASATPLVVAP